MSEITPETHWMELVIGGQPHLRCTGPGCSYRYNFLGKATVISTRVIRLVEDAHQKANAKEGEE